MTASHVPLLVLSAGQRCGSTLLQRLLTSHPEVLIWGETGGQLGKILEAADQMGAWSENLGGQGRTEFSQRSYQGWMANLLPDREQITEAIHQFVDLLFVEPAVRLGRPIWGLKEVRYTLEDVRRFQMFYPRLAVIMVIRDPRDVLRSLDEWERKTDGRWTRALTEGAVENWARVAEDFLAPPDAGLPILRLRYEDMTADPDGTYEAVARHTGLGVTAFDPNVFATRVHAGEDLAHLPRDLRQWDDLPDDLRSLLDPPHIQSLLHACGYQRGVRPLS
ncbi:sulfotransferase family protein [Acrocarpospora catenulata]|uniref:sulfotransferase family protein n=1 Tax=Acrocarpospora catenulata TaxID=2836182 RepID=UPI001BDAA4D9|nr:sulfotransferase [Acrocarpospora catenulata]